MPQQRIPNSDFAYAYIAGLTDEEQERVLYALLNDMRPETVKRVLNDHRYYQV
jgi:hypothetical protein